MENNSGIKNPVKGLKNLVSKSDFEHVWQFSRIGGVNRVNLLSGKDIVYLSELDQKLWTALSCPVNGLEIDAGTLRLIDTDNDGRVRVPEILAATRWIVSVIRDPEDLVKINTTLPLSAINVETEEGRVLFASAKQILTHLGKADQDSVSVAETSDTARIFSGTRFNGDGVITVESAGTDALKKRIQNIIDCMGSVSDLSGQPGVNTDLVNAFFQSCQAYSEWYTIAESQPEIYWPYADQTAAAYQAYLAVKTKIEDFYTRCRLLDYEPVAEEALNVAKSRFETIAGAELNEDSPGMSGFPLARTNKEKMLPLEDGLNPSWEKAIRQFNREVVQPKFSGKKALSFEEWKKVQSMFSGYSGWIDNKKGAEVEALGIEEIRAILSGQDTQELLALIEEDRRLETETRNILNVDRLVRYYCDIYTLLKNYVSFSDFYSPEALAIFQAGKLYIDQRCLDLCIQVNDMPRHNTLAVNSGICLLYCDCISRNRNEKMTIVAALTDGDIDNVSVGRNAVFYDRKGRDWDATIVKIVDNPISIKQAFWSPYKKFSRFISKQIEKLAASKEAEVEAATTAQIEKAVVKADSSLTESVKSPALATPQAVQTAQAPPAPFDIGKFAGIFAALSLAIGAIGSVIISALAGFFELKWWQMPLALVGMILCISLPSMVLAWLKLRKRDLAPVLDANGWAINARLTINIIFGKTLTHLAMLPDNARVNLTDPFSKKKRPIVPALIIFLIVLAIAAYALWFYGYLNEWGIWKFRI